ncbi:MAG: hypothetical protein CL666_03345 [Balneola sp.]|nr:hypothetical protein [Balneola sp.]|tara:strand:- start:5972 stop:6412 length:441 start_codon:yes stop_codon:yes gene_type:complete
MEHFKNGKKIVTALLAFTCIISGIILASTPAPTFQRLDNFGELDSLLQVQFQESRILSSQIRTSTVHVDSNLTRKEFRIEVPSRFSKTLFHVHLDKKLTPYGLDTPARVHFPSRDMDIFLYYNNTILRTLRLTTDTDLDTLQTEQF